MKTPCQHEPELWVADHAALRREAVALCRDCPVIAKCLEDAIANRERHHVWGGVDFSDERTRPKFEVALPSIKHGTDGGYRAHRRRGEMPCAACTKAASDAARIRHQRRKGKAA